MKPEEMSELAGVEFTQDQAQILERAAKRAALLIGHPVARWSTTKARLKSTQSAVDRILKQTGDETPEAALLAHFIGPDAMMQISRLPDRLSEAMARVEAQTSPGRDQDEALVNFVSLVRRTWRDAGGKTIGGYKSEHHDSGIDGPLINLIEALLTDAGCDHLPSRQTLLNTLKATPEENAEATICYSGIHAPRG